MVKSHKMQICILKLPSFAYVLTTIFFLFRSVRFILREKHMVLLLQDLKNYCRLNYPNLCNVFQQNQIGDQRQDQTDHHIWGQGGVLPHDQIGMIRLVWTVGFASSVVRAVDFYPRSLRHILTTFQRRTLAAVVPLLYL